MDNTDDILVEFIIEAREILDQLDLDFVLLEKTPDDKKLVGNIFRAIHTLKGSSGFFAFKRLEKVTHAGETLLGKIRDGSLALDKQKTSLLLVTLDAVREIVAGIEATNTEPEGDNNQLIEDLLNLANGVTLADKKLNEAVQAIPLPKDLLNLANGVALADKKLNEAEQAIPLPIEPAKEAIAQILEAAIPTPPPDEPATVATHSATPASSTAEQELGVETPQEIAQPVKVNLDLLDKLMNLVSEMVLARNRLLPFAADFGDHHFTGAVRTIDLLTQELQERMMMTRMQPISHIWSKFPRLIRDVSNECGKQVNLIQEGADTELDRTLLDAIRDPLVHIIRNCIDHGIETPEQRAHLGKPAMGQVLLKASHENGMVVIQIADDGGGIDFDLVRQKATEKKLFTAEHALTLTDMQLLEYIFLPGFSTKSVVTSLSGRGVGMDVVKTNITKIGGSIEIDSPRGVGTNICLKIPLTLAVMPALFVRCEDERYAIPQNSIVEMVRLDLANDSTGLEDFYGLPVFRLRNKLAPLLLLNHQLNLSQKFPGKDAVVNIALLQSGGIQFGLLVDEVLNMQEVVVKPLGPLFSGSTDFAGATILGNGSVALILDVGGMANNSGLVAKIQARPLNPVQIAAEVTVEQIPMLLFELPGLEFTAIPLECVDRLESFTVEKIQKNGKREVVQYGNGLMHLLRLNEYIDGVSPTPVKSQEPLSVIAHYVNGLPMGLVVGKVHDIIQVPKIMQESNSQQRGLKGCVILNGRVINVIDVQEILRMRRIQDNEIVVYPDNEQSEVAVIDWKMVQ
jgi:two-component system chemotaxis sensor kinase CheA